MKLQRRQVGVDAAQRHQRRVRPGFHDAPVFHYDDAVGALHGGQAVCDDERGAPAHGRFQRALHQAFRFGVERAGGFVQQQQRRVLEQRARDGDALALAA
jgi:hypothetical protein